MHDDVSVLVAAIMWATMEFVWALIPQSGRYLTKFGPSCRTREQLLCINDSALLIC